MWGVYVVSISILDAMVEGVRSGACEAGFRATKARLPLEVVKLVAVFVA